MTEQMRRNTARFGWLAGAVGAGVLAFSVLNVTGGLTAQPAAPRVAATPAASFADVIDSVSPAVVNIAVMKVETAPTSFEYQGQPGQQSLPFEFFERFFNGNGDPRQGDSRGPERRSEGQGSGFLIDANGYIVTNNHVAGGADQITVTMQDGRKFDAKLVGNDARSDLALIKIEATGLPYVAFGDSDKARVGDWVVAIGNPFGLGGTATAGIISARGRDIRLDQYNDNDYLQLDAPINFGNSGGPVFNVAGQVVGVNTAIFSPNGGNVGIGFAMPINRAKAMLDDFQAGRKRPRLGVSVVPVAGDYADALNLPTQGGLLIQEVSPNTAAARAGLRGGREMVQIGNAQLLIGGDLIMSIDGKPVDRDDAITRALSRKRAGDALDLTIFRNGKTTNLKVTLGEDNSNRF